MDIKEVYTVDLRERLNPLGYRENHKGTSEIGYYHSDDQEFPLGTKQEISGTELSPFLKHLWNGDINAWETLMSHRILVHTHIHQAVKDNRGLFFRPNVLRKKVLGMARIFADKAVAESNGKAAAHTLKSLYLLCGLIEGDERPTEFYARETELIQAVRRQYTKYDRDFLEAVSQLRTRIEAYSVDSDKEEMGRGTLYFIETLYGRYGRDAIERWIVK